VLTPQGLKILTKIAQGFQLAGCSATGIWRWQYRLVPAGNTAGPLYKLGVGMR
jgi:hypothetical protein